MLSESFFYTSLAVERSLFINENEPHCFENLQQHFKSNQWPLLKKKVVTVLKRTENGLSEKKYVKFSTDMVLLNQPTL